MKKLFKNISLVALGVFAFASCVPEESDSVKSLREAQADKIAAEALKETALAAQEEEEVARLKFETAKEEEAAKQAVLTTLTQQITYDAAKSLYDGTNADHVAAEVLKAQTELVEAQGLAAAAQKEYLDAQVEQLTAEITLKQTKLGEGNEYYSKSVAELSEIADTISAANIKIGGFLSDLTAAKGAVNSDSATIASKTLAIAQKEADILGWQAAIVTNNANIAAWEIEYAADRVAYNALLVAHYDTTAARDLAQSTYQYLRYNKPTNIEGTSSFNSSGFRDYDIVASYPLAADASFTHTDSVRYNRSKAVGGDYHTYQLLENKYAAINVLLSSGGKYNLNSTANIALKNNVNNYYDNNFKIVGGVADGNYELGSTSTASYIPYLIASAQDEIDNLSTGYNKQIQGARNDIQALKNEIAQLIAPDTGTIAADLDRVSNVQAQLAAERAKLAKLQERLTALAAAIGQAPAAI